MQGFSNIEISCSVLFLPARATNYYSENMTLKFQSEFSPFEIKTNFIVRFFTHGLKGHWNTKARRISWGWRLKTLFARCTAVKNKNNKQTMHSCKLYFLSYGDGRIERQMGHICFGSKTFPRKNRKENELLTFFAPATNVAFTSGKTGIHFRKSTNVSATMFSLAAALVLFLYSFRILLVFPRVNFP